MNSNKLKRNVPMLMDASFSRGRRRYEIKTNRLVYNAMRVLQ